MDEDKTKSTQTCVILVKCSQSIVAWCKGNEYKSSIGFHVKTVEKSVAQAIPTQEKWAKPTNSNCGLTAHFPILYKLHELHPNNIALAIEAAKAKAQGALIVTNTTNKHSEILTGDGGTTN